MTVEQAIERVTAQLACIERKNADAELRPWMRDACADASEHWGLTHQRIALSRSNPQGRACCASLNLDRAERTAAQKKAAEANGRRLAAAKAA
jgi:hypothetical protein